jgi:acyl dehydratase
VPARVVESIEALKALAGSEIGASDWLAIAEERIQQFAEVTEDRQWIHVNHERAERESPYGTTVAHGFLTLSLLSHFLKQVIEVRGVRMGINYGLNRVRFPAPVRSGTRIRARVRLDSAQDFKGGMEAVFSFTVECDGAAKPCCVAEWIVRYYAE